MEIIEIIKFSIYISGYRRNIFIYMVLALLNPVIIGLPLIREDNVIIRPATDIFNYKFLRPNDFDKSNNGIIKDKGINSGAIYNINKRGQEILKTAYGI